MRVARHFGIINLPPNFAPISGIALFSGTYFKDRRWAVILPLSAMLISDFLIGFYDWRVLASVYASFALVGLLGLWVRSKKTIVRIGAAAAASSIIFYLITNLAVWLFSGMYALTWSELVRCYALALPFLRWTFSGDIFYVIILFGAYEIICHASSYLVRRKLAQNYVSYSK